MPRLTNTGSTTIEVPAPAGGTTARGPSPRTNQPPAPSGRRPSLKGFPSERRLLGKGRR